MVVGDEGCWRSMKDGRGGEKWFLLEENGFNDFIKYQHFLKTSILNYSKILDKYPKQTIQKNSYVF